ncbi:MAG: response regulator transcription factor [Propionibacteriaceae bacterium]|nr:response regulator transcription factor [Propionibacteriaceae bacterium]
MKVLLAEDKAAIRESFSVMLRMQKDMEVTAVRTGREALAYAWTQKPDIALLDIRMPDVTGLDVLKDLKESVPECRCIMLTTFAMPNYVLEAYEDGAWAFLQKDASFKTILDTVRRVNAGERVFDQSLLEHAQQAGANPLSKKEADILRTTAQYGSTSEVAKQLHMSKGTIDNYFSTIMAKLNVTSRIQAYYTAQRNGWL